MEKDVADDVDNDDDYDDDDDDEPQYRKNVLVLLFQTVKIWRVLKKMLRLR